MEHPRRTHQEWLNLITDCRTSGMSITAWCKANSIPKGTYESAVRRLISQGYPAPSGKSQSASAQKVICVLDPVNEKQFPDTVSSKTALILDIYGCHLEILNQAAPETIRSALTVLQELC